MATEYDLVILGGTPAARHAALYARSWQARVALIEPANTHPHELLCHRVWVNQVQHVANPIAMPNPADATARPPSQSWLGDGCRAAVQITEQSRSLDVLTQRGIDVILGWGELQRKPDLHVVAGGRSLSAHAVLIATGSRSVVPSIVGIESVPVLTLESLWQPDALPQLPADWLIVGDTPTAIELAQTARQLGCRVWLALPGQRVLPLEDTDAAFLVMAQLEAEGVRVLPHCTLEQFEKTGDRTRVHTSTARLEVDCVVIADRRQPAIEGLHLDTVGVRCRPQGIPTNRRLQTSNPRIYACGDVLGGYPMLHIAEREAEIAVYNALFWPSQPMKYHTHPWALYTQPGLGRIGLTETQARQRFGDDVIVLKESSTQAAIAPFSSQTRFCKLITRRNGTLIGAHWVAPHVWEAMGTLAIAMQQGLTLHDLASTPSTPTLAIANDITQLAAHWLTEQRQRAWQQTLIEWWFNRRR